MLPDRVAAGQPIRAAHMNEILSRLRAVDSTPSGAGALRGLRGKYQTAIGVNLEGADIPWASVVAIDDLAVASGADINVVLPGQTVKVRQVATGTADRANAGNQLFIWADPLSKIGILQGEMKNGQPVEVMTSGISICRLVRNYTDTETVFADRQKYAVPQCGVSPGFSAVARNALVSSPVGPFEILWEDESGPLSAEHFAVVKFHVPADPGALIVVNNSSEDFPPWSAIWDRGSYGGAIGCVTAISTFRPGGDNIPAAAVLFTGANGIKAGRIGVAYSAFDRPCRATTEDNTVTPGPWYSWGTVNGSFKLKAGNRGFTSSTSISITGETIWARPFEQASNLYKQRVLSFAVEGSPNAGGTFTYTGQMTLEDSEVFPLLVLPAGHYRMLFVGTLLQHGDHQYQHGYGAFDLLTDSGDSATSTIRIALIGDRDGALAGGGGSSWTGFGDPVSFGSQTALQAIAGQTTGVFEQGYDGDGQPYTGSHGTTRATINGWLYFYRMFSSSED